MGLEEFSDDFDAAIHRLFSFFGHKGQEVRRLSQSHTRPYRQAYATHKVHPIIVIICHPQLISFVFRFVVSWVQLDKIVRSCSQYDLKRQSWTERQSNKHVTEGKRDRNALRKYVLEFGETDEVFREARTLLGYPKPEGAAAVDHAGKQSSHHGAGVGKEATKSLRVAKEEGNKA